jgi:hypothetical protein
MFELSEGMSAVAERMRMRMRMRNERMRVRGGEEGNSF